MRLSLSMEEYQRLYGPQVDDDGVFINFVHTSP